VILTRTPLRLSLGGGGTDLPNYAAEHGGLVLSAAIDRYVYVAVHEDRVDRRLRFSHEGSQLVDGVEELDHPITREALRTVGLDGGTEVVSMGSVPAGTGLGSSGAYCVGLLRALHALQGRDLSGTALAEQAWQLERERLGRWVGKHDHYLAALGDFRALHIDRDGSVDARPLRLPDGTAAELAGTLLLAYTGQRRDSGRLLAEQDRPADRAGGDRGSDGRRTSHLHEIKRIGADMGAALTAGRVGAVGALFDRHWQTKRDAADGISDPWMDTVYAEARRNGALGGKLLGAGGGGFFLFAVEPDARERVGGALHRLGLRTVPFGFSHTGSSVLLHALERS
jgi:D-glycero-alpha-D-manno-heptose-7-phosphate kinase